jgi:hypothetical protein
MWAQTLLHRQVQFNVVEYDSWEAFKGVGFGLGAPSTLVADESVEDQDIHWDNY